MTGSFKRVILYARQHRANQDVNESLHRLADWLKAKQYEVFLDRETFESFNLKLPVLERDKMGEKGDLVIVVGGDGSLLSAARMAIEVDVPVIGVNRGRLGFLTDINPKNMEEEIEEVFAGQYNEEKRFLLNATICDDENSYFNSNALNDIVLSRGEGMHLIEFDVVINHQLVASFRSDGMILATPTGSTAYALSAGGPIMHPRLDAMVLVPMFSHSLSSRPLVVDGQSKIELRISERNEHSLRLSCDGHESQMVKPGQTVRIEKNSQTLRLLHPRDYHYYERLRVKLGWESRFKG